MTGFGWCPVSGSKPLHSHSEVYSTALTTLTISLISIQFPQSVVLHPGTALSLQHTYNDQIALHLNSDVMYLSQTSVSWEVNIFTHCPFYIFWNFLMDRWRSTAPRLWSVVSVWCGHGCMKSADRRTRSGEDTNDCIPWCSLNRNLGGLLREGYCSQGN